MNTLFQFHADIDAHVKTINSDQPDWLCRQGCDGCCRRLAEIPRLTSAEWDGLREGLASLPFEQLAEIGQEIAALVGQQRPIICPLLDLATKSCRVYAHRPVACRTYGFYVQRNQGLYCTDIESQVAEGALAKVVWGNHDGIDRRLRGLGDSRELTEWFAHWKENGDGD